VEKELRLIEQAVYAFRRETDDDDPGDAGEREKAETIRKARASVNSKRNSLPRPKNESSRPSGTRILQLLLPRPTPCFVAFAKVGPKGPDPTYRNSASALWALR